MNYRGITIVKNILLTGATGVLGGRLLQEILSTTDACVYCLVRGDTLEAALHRIEEVLYAYDEGRTLTNQSWRIIPLLGDVSKPQLGLSSEAYDELAASVGLAMHCAANVSLVAAYTKIAPVNVGGTSNMVKFCLSGNIPLMYASSFSVLGDKLFKDAFVLHENDLDVGQGFKNMDYEHTKFDAEKLIHEGGRRGLDWVIVRPGNIWGDSSTGCYPLKVTRVKGIYYEMLKSLIETGLSVSSDESFDVSPVDYVAKAMLFAAFNLHVSNRRTFHLTNPRPPTYNDFVQCIKAYGYTIRPVGMKVYFEALTDGRILRGGRVYRSTFTDLLSIFYEDDDDAEERAKYATDAIERLLLGTGIACPNADAALLACYFDYAIKVGFLPGPDAQHPLAEISSTPKHGNFLENLYNMDSDELNKELS